MFGFLDRFEQDFLGCRLLEIQGHAFLIAAQAPEKAGTAPGRIPAPGPLNLSDLGAKVSQEHGTTWARILMGRIQDRDSV